MIHPTVEFIAMAAAAGSLVLLFLFSRSARAILIECLTNPFGGPQPIQTSEFFPSEGGSQASEKRKAGSR